MSLTYIIRYDWPKGKVRYRMGSKLCANIEDADVFSLYGASQIIKRSKDARVVWDIQTSKILIRDLSSTLQATLSAKTIDGSL